jgi:co-chaperonin GroES (HSP10)
MLTDEQCTSFRPLGQRLLVKRYGLQNQSQGGIHVIGRDFPTLGRVVRMSSRQFGGNEIDVGSEVQWSIKPDFDQRCVIGPDWLCLDLDDINVCIDDRGIARAVGNRILLKPTKELPGWGTPSMLVVGEFYLTRWAIGRIQSLGGEVDSDTGYGDVIYNPSMRSELILNNQQYFVVRDEDCIATVED